ncbi:50S ribosomal protein L4 [Candidatus Woesearchaeota archaeon]|jgi:large subunit ribosomal protein L4e|nr:50S ribosomal protein L4 [Candidatus Woesearchaeota archaeon]MBT4368720.1 50S ribosomal protein L4 [Candidatus Woesearchaeota archaeon]MBT4712009.1 50S ribosomal protein L4 [Candidatus Woesearchaeota archaeon]MBT6638904.1 50S ribosomal protein L4 [Candidatus Woesearchaeota archaeon]MBT7134548.1 50S ribosomal protein L4 [Candidatus Woesearchaeota archaeon]
MKLNILNLKGENKGTIDMPKQFNEELRPNLIKRAFIAVNSKTIQPYGSKPGAGMRSSSKVSRRRHNYRGAYGIGISRVPRKVLTSRGTRFNWVGASAPGTVGGRKAHSPKAEKIIIKDINKKERRKAIRCALSATLMKEVVETKHQVPEKYPFIIESGIENIKKTSELIKALKSFGLEKELDRVKVKKIRAGKGTMRGRKYKTKTGPLIVVSKECEVERVKNVPGVEIAKVNEINAKILAPGAEAGRLVLFSEDSIKKISEDKLFI